MRSAIYLSRDLDLLTAEIFHTMTVRGDNISIKFEDRTCTFHA